MCCSAGQAPYTRTLAPLRYTIITVMNVPGPGKNLCDRPGGLGRPLGKILHCLSQAPWCHCPAVLVPCLTALCRPGAPQGSSLCMGMDQTRRPSPEPCHECRHLRACIWGRLRSRAFILKGLMNLPACLPTYQPACLELSAKLRLMKKIR